MKFNELSTGVIFSLVPDNNQKYIKLPPPSLTGHTCNARTYDSIYFNFPPDQEVSILNNFKQEPSSLEGV